MTSYPKRPSWSIFPVPGNPYHMWLRRLGPMTPYENISAAPWLPFFSYPYVSWTWSRNALIMWYMRPYAYYYFLGISIISKGNARYRHSQDK